MNNRDLKESLVADPTTSLQGLHYRRMDTMSNDKPKTQLAHRILTQEQIDAVVSDYRDRVRDGDGDELRQMLMEAALEVYCPLEAPGTMKRLKQVLVEDMKALFESPAEDVLVGPESDEEKLEHGSVTFPYNLETARVLGLFDGGEYWTAFGISGEIGCLVDVAERHLALLLEEGAIEEVLSKSDDKTYCLKVAKDEFDVFPDKDPETLPVKALEDGDDAAKLRGKILDVMYDGSMDISWTPEMLAEKCEVDVEAVRDVLPSLEDADRITHTNDGYELCLGSDEDEDDSFTEVGRVFNLLEGGGTWTALDVSTNLQISIEDAISHLETLLNENGLELVNRKPRTYALKPVIGNPDEDEVF